MLDFPTWKKFWLWGLTLIAAAAALPTLLASTNIDIPDFLPQPTVNLGLDLAGGSHILLEADPAQVAEQKLENTEENVRSTLRGTVPENRIRIGDLSTADGQLSFMLDNPADLDRAREVLLPIVNGTGLVREWDLTVSDGQRMILTPTEDGIETAVSQAMESATEVVRKRIDSLGTREPTIIRQGDTRIVVQVPGLDDPDQLKALLGQTARLEFKMVDQTALPSDVQQGIAPLGSEIFPYVDDAAQAGTSVAVRRLGGIRGDSLTNAQQGFDPQTNEPVVNIQFDQQGGARFAQLSTQNVGRQFAIILDGQVLSTPVFNEPILGGSAQIAGSFTVESANNLAISLNSGALPVDLTVIEERTVGPDLGADSIRKGMLAMLIGSAAVIALMIASYGRFGVYATIALVFNVMILLGIMAGLNTTLTLPGIAGFVLTIGAAVDANVLINERIREERKRGRRVIAAVENGYKEASRAIYDANITNFIAGVLLFLFGSGPIRGFAVVLVIGLFTSVFTAVVLTRMWVVEDPVIQRFGEANQVSIRVKLPEEAEGQPEFAAMMTEQITAAMRDGHPEVRIDGVDSVSGKVSGEFRNDALLALIAAMLAVAIYIWIRFEWQFGAGALFALFHDVSLTLGMFAVFQLEFSLQIIAAILAIIGYSLNDTIVVYDRIRENLKKFRKMDLTDLLDLSVNETLARTVMTSLTLFVALLPLLLFGPASLFGLVAAITLGLFVGTYSSVYMAAPILIWLGVTSNSFVPQESAADLQEKKARGLS
eukprot:g14264.t1